MDRRSKHFLHAGVFGVLLTALALIFTALLIRNVSVFLQAEPQFQAIFSQIRRAELGYPVWLMVPQGGICLLASWLWQRKKQLAGIAVLLGGGILMLLCALYFTRVNGILFGDVMVSLVQVLMKGGLDL